MRARPSRQSKSFWPAWIGITCNGMGEEAREVRKARAVARAKRLDWNGLDASYVVFAPVNEQEGELRLLERLELVVAQVMAFHRVDLPLESKVALLLQGGAVHVLGPERHAPLNFHATLPVPRSFSIGIGAGVGAILAGRLRGALVPGALLQPLAHWFRRHRDLFVEVLAREVAFEV